MTPEYAKAHCLKYGSVLRHYKTGYVATVVLPSCEVIIVSIGTSSAKIFIKRAFFGWLFPRTVGKKDLAGWIPDFKRLSGMQRFAARAMVLDGLVSLTSRAKYAGELSLAWAALRNPVEVAVEECGWGMEQEEEIILREQQAQCKSEINETPVNPGSLLEKTQEVSSKFIVSFYRQLGAHNKCSPTAKTPDDKIIAIYSLVSSAFRTAAERRGERIPEVFLNTIVAGFLQINENKGEDFMREHLQYETDKYLREGLRSDYRQPLPFFTDEETEIRKAPNRDEPQSDAVAWLSKGQALAELGRPEQAIAWYDKALAMDPRLAKAWFDKAKALFSLRRLDEAKTCFAKAIEIDPQCVADWAGEVIHEAQKRQRPDCEAKDE